MDLKQVKLKTRMTKLDKILDKDIIKQAASLLGVKESQVPIRAQELFKKWKKAKKAFKKGNLEESTRDSFPSRVSRS